MNKVLNRIVNVIWILVILWALWFGIQIVYNIFQPSYNPIPHVSDEIGEEIGIMFNEGEYCEVQTINGTAVCLPEGVCEFQENSEGRKICLAKRV